MRLSHLYKRVCPSVGRSVGPLVRRSVGTTFVKIAKSIGTSSFFACMLHVHPFIDLSVGTSVRWSVGPSVCNNTFKKVFLLKIKTFEMFSNVS